MSEATEVAGKTGRPGVVDSTIRPALEGMFGDRKVEAEQIDRLGDRPVPDVASLRNGSSNLWLASRTGRMILGEHQFPNAKTRNLLHRDAIEAFYCAQLGPPFCTESERIGWRGNEGISTTYDQIHKLCALAILEWLNENEENDSQLERYVLEWLSRELALTAALAFGKSPDYRICGAGVRNTIDESGDGRIFLNAIAGVGRTPHKTLQQWPLAFLLRRQADRLRELLPSVAPCLLWLEKGEKWPLQEVLDLIRLGIGGLEVRHYDRGGCVAHFPSGLRGAAVGDTKKASRRPYAVGIPGERLGYVIAPNGWIAFTHIEDGYVRAICGPEFESRHALPPGADVAQFHVPRLESAWVDW